MARITVEDCIDKFESRFELVLVASNRARKLHSGETPTVEKDNDKNTVIALREIADETINADVLKDKLVEEYQTVSLQSEEELTYEQSLENDTTEEENYESSVIKTEVETTIQEENKSTIDQIDNDNDFDIEVSQNIDQDEIATQTQD